MAVAAARFRVRLAGEPDPAGAVRPHPARPRNLATEFFTWRAAQADVEAARRLLRREGGQSPEPKDQLE